VYCKKHKAIIAIRICLLRQDIAYEKKQEGENLTSFVKCYKCILGNKIRMNPDPKLDKDVRTLMRLYIPKPLKCDLKLQWRKPIRKILRKPTKYNLKG